MTVRALLTAGLALLGPGCLWANSHSQSVTAFDARAMVGAGGDRRVEGGQLRAAAGYAGVLADADLTVRDGVRVGEPSRYRTATVGVGLRASPLAILATDHWLERYLDFGFDAGAGIGAAFGVPPHGAAFVASGWVGAWVELGTVPIGDGYLSVTGAIRQESFDAAWTDRSQLSLGVGYRTRQTVRAEQLRWRD